MSRQQTYQTNQQTNTLHNHSKCRNPDHNYSTDLTDAEQNPVASSNGKELTNHKREKILFIGPFFFFFKLTNQKTLDRPIRGLPKVDVDSFIRRMWRCDWLVKKYSKMQTLLPVIIIFGVGFQQKSFFKGHKVVNSGQLLLTHRSVCTVHPL